MSNHSGIGAYWYVPLHLTKESNASGGAIDVATDQKFQVLC